MHNCEFMIMNLDFVYPIGSIYLSINSTNPSKWFGGTWVAWGTGRVPVGVDPSQTEFDTVEKIGGSKDLQAHRHYGLYYIGNSIGINSGSGLTFHMSYGSGGTGDLRTGETGTGNSGNLQPYITCYMWKRTA